MEARRGLFAVRLPSSHLLLKTSVVSFFLLAVHIGTSGKASGAPMRRLLQNPVVSRLPISRRLAGFRLRIHRRSWSARSSEAKSGGSYEQKLSIMQQESSSSTGKESKGITLEDLKFDNLVLRELPVDKGNNVPRPVKNACFSLVDPTPIEDPELVSASQDALNIIDLDAKEVERKDFAEYFCGNKILSGARPAAHCYCGHQFGYFSGQLGDGATMFLGQIINSKNERWEIQYKGAGKTPFSRTADGRKVLRSSIREFLCSEAMAGLGIPTTRAPTCITSQKTKVVRDIFYDGHPEDEQCTVITRLAPSFIRFGSFEIFKPEDSVTHRSGPSAYNVEILEQLLNHVIKEYYSSIWTKHKESKDKGDMYLDFYKQVVRRTASLVAKWQCVGWCHGVLNTDNMSILGLTIDFGPFGFMERTDPEYICNNSDNDGRYSYKNQPKMCKWNCFKLAEALSPTKNFVFDEEKAKKSLDVTFQEAYEAEYYGTMRKKLGLHKGVDEKRARQLVDSLLDTMATSGADFTLTFRNMSKCVRGLVNGAPKEGEKDEFLETLKKSSLATHQEILDSLEPSMPIEKIKVLVSMARQNPYVAQRFPSLLKDLKKLELLREYNETPEEERTKATDEKWTAWLQNYRQTLLKSTNDAKQFADIANEMDKSNPKFILRNYMLQEAISKAEVQDYSYVNALLELVRNPFMENPSSEVGFTKKKLETYAAKPPKEAAKIAVT